VRRLSRRESLLAFVLGVVVFLVASLTGCPRNRSDSPVAPTVIESRVSVTANPVPLVAVHDSPFEPLRYRVPAQLSFRELAGQPARITRLNVEIVASTGWTTAAAQDADIRVPAGGVVDQTISTVINAPGPASTGRWRLTVTATGGDGQAIVVAPTESELKFASAPAPAADEVFVGAGDIGQCGGGQAASTASVLDRMPGTVFTLGDNAQGTGAAEEYANCYGPTWGRHLVRTLPTVGNHDWDVTGGGPYFAYFGASAGSPGRGYYSVELGAWHVISLNSEAAAGAGSAQYEWLKADLAASSADCTLVMWHRPLFSSGPNGGSSRMRDAWRLLQQHGAELVLSGHDHHYERFAPQDADGRALATGIRAFVVGTGGYSLYWRASSVPNSEVFDSRTWGVLRLTLKAASYDWEFVPIAGQNFRDVGSAHCTAPPR
jgi:acid phosphatase type 7